MTEGDVSHLIKTFPWAKRYNIGLYDQENYCIVPVQIFKM